MSSYENAQNELREQTLQKMRDCVTRNCLRMVEKREFNFADFRILKELYLLKMRFPDINIYEIIHDITNNSGYSDEEVSKMISSMIKKDFIDFIDEEEL